MNTSFRQLVEGLFDGLSNKSTSNDKGEQISHMLRKAHSGGNKEESLHIANNTLHNPNSEEHHINSALELIHKHGGYKEDSAKIAMAHKNSGSDTLINVLLKSSNPSIEHKVINHPSFNSYHANMLVNRHTSDPKKLAWNGNEQEHHKAGNAVLAAVAHHKAGSTIVDGLARETNSPSLLHAISTSPHVSVDGLHNVANNKHSSKETIDHVRNTASDSMGIHKSGTKLHNEFGKLYSHMMDRKYKQ